MAYARQQSTAPHGGGYIYRLCPLNDSLTEDCFNRIPLEFATPEKHTLRFKDPKKDHDVKVCWHTAVSAAAHAFCYSGTLFFVCIPLIYVNPQSRV